LSAYFTDFQPLLTQGYYLYACSLMGQWNSTFVSEYGPIVDAVMYDVTHSSHASSDDTSNGAFFPLARHKAWFDGHSFASGLFRSAAGKSQESSSESINCYYGAYLWSSVRGTSKAHMEQFNFSRLLLATEIRGIKTYWHMKPADSGSSTRAASPFNPTFAKTLMVGNLGMMDATVTTWFGNNPIYVHMINFLPVTAITRRLFDKSYLQREYTDVIKPIFNSVEMAW
jgi:endo-1,3(4)-beta-glucanase